VYLAERNILVITFSAGVVYAMIQSRLNITYTGYIVPGVPSFRAPNFTLALPNSTDVLSFSDIASVGNVRLSIQFNSLRYLVCWHCLFCLFDEIDLSYADIYLCTYFFKVVIVFTCWHLGLTLLLDIYYGNYLLIFITGIVFLFWYSLLCLFFDICPCNYLQPFNLNNYVDNIGKCLWVSK